MDNYTTDELASRIDDIESNMYALEWQLEELENIFKEHKETLEFIRKAKEAVEKDKVK